MRAGPHGARAADPEAQRPGSAPIRRKVATRTKAAYGLGSIAYGIKDNGFSALLLLFYNQVMGLSPSLVGLAIMIALVLDALIDPIVGTLSDRLRSRWGRRHPFMYAAAIPAGVLYMLLWNPPHASEAGMLAYLVVMAILVRTAISCYEVPSFALAPELTGDYDERTSIMGWRYLFAWVGGMTMVLITFAVILAPTAAYPVGQLNPQGYARYGIFAGAVMIMVILVSAVGTHREIAHLPKASAAGDSLKASLAAFRNTLRNRAFLTLLVSGMFMFAGQGLGSALTTYFYTYLWQFPSYALAWFTVAVIAGAVIAFALTARVSRGFEKRYAAAFCVLMSAVMAVLPLVLRLLGLFPANDSPALLPILLVMTMIGVVFLVGASTLTASMMADVVEDGQVRTGERTEGLFFAGSFFMQKCVSGLGLFMSGAVLALARFPAAALPGKVEQGVLDQLVIIYCAIAMTLAALAAFVLTRFPLGRADHDHRLSTLAAIEGEVLPLPGAEPTPTLATTER